MWRNSEIALLAKKHLDEKTKPLGSLGKLESLAQQIAVAQGRTSNLSTRTARLLIFAADHGVSSEGVSAYPKEVTRQMIDNLALGGAAACVLCKEHEIDLQVIDVGVDYGSSSSDLELASIADAPYASSIHSFPIKNGTKNFVEDFAMTLEETRVAMDVGATFAAKAADASYDIICLGELGIGNTASAAALFSALCGRPASETVGRGTGVDDAALAKKIFVVETSLKHHEHVISSGNPEMILSALGGFEIAALVGAILEGTQRRKLIVLDGFTVTVAYLVALRMKPEIREECIVFSHVSHEQAHRKLLEQLGAQERPLLEFQMRLGEGSGACLAVPLLRSAASIFNNMATFASANVSTANKQE